MRIEKVQKICIIDDSYKFDEKYIFNSFYQSNSKIVYIVEGDYILKGIITIGDFLKCIRNKSNDYIRYSYSVIKADREERVIEEARKIICERKITTAIPVIDKKGKLLYEVKLELLPKEKVLQSYKNKFEKLEGSYYLKDEVVALKKVLNSQKILMIGNESLLRKIFGSIFINKDNISFLENVTDAYTFLTNREYLLIDLNVSRFEAREEIYRICNNGYSWEGFYEAVFKNIQENLCSQLLRVCNNSYCTLDEWVNEFVIGKIDVVTNSILYNAIKESSAKSYELLNVEKKLIRDEYCKYCTNDGAVHNTSDFAAIIRLTDINFQMAEINNQLKNKIPMLNFVCQKEVITSENENMRITEPKGVLDMLKDEKCSNLYNYEKYKLFFAQLTEEFNIGLIRRVENDFFTYTEHLGKIINITNGLRKTCGQPEEFLGTVYMCGVCTVFGSLVEDRYTIPSILQEMILKTNKKYRVVNLGNVFPQSINELIKNIEFKKNDLVITFFPQIVEKIQTLVPCIDMSDKVNFHREKYKDKDLFCESIYHVGTFGNLVYAEVMYEEIKRYLRDNKHQHMYVNNVYDIFQKDKRDMEYLYGFDDFLEEVHIYDHKIPKNVKSIGCIGMNCNPFTKGHRYLVEYAAKQVDFLYIFVMEENKSYFQFKDRMEMVRRGTADLDNVVVVRTGKMMGSDITFPAYFEKEKETKIYDRISPATDLRIFSQYIAPEFGIQCRFVGEEPSDACTREYNECMQEILPSFGIKVIEIPRKTDRNGNVISASRVREFYKNNDFEGMKELVPQTTLDYLMGLKPNNI